MHPLPYILGIPLTLYIGCTPYPIYWMHPLPYIGCTPYPICRFTILLTLSFCRMSPSPMLTHSNVLTPHSCTSIPRDCVRRAGMISHRSIARKTVRTMKIAVSEGITLRLPKSYYNRHHCPPITFHLDLLG